MHSSSSSSGAGPTAGSNAAPQLRCFGLGCKCGRIPEEPTPAPADDDYEAGSFAADDDGGAEGIVPAIPGLFSMVRRAHSDYSWSLLEAQVIRFNPVSTESGTRSLMADGTTAAAAAAAAAAGNSRSSSGQQSCSPVAVPWTSHSSMCRPATAAAGFSSAGGKHMNTGVSTPTARAASAALAAAAATFTTTAVAAAAARESSGSIAVGCGYDNTSCSTRVPAQQRISSTRPSSSKVGTVPVTRTYSACIDHVDYELQQLTHWWSIVDQVVDQLQLDGMRLQEQLEKWGRQKGLLEGLVRRQGGPQGFAGDNSDPSRMKNHR